MPREYPLDRYRNFGIMAHIDAGKTTTTERILFYTGKSPQDRRGARRRRDDGLDGAGAGAGHHHHLGRDHDLLGAHRGRHDADGPKHRFNIIDTPGHVDFTIEVERSLAVLDGAVCVLDANAGVEPQTETVWRQADRYEVPRIVFVNKMDKIGADFFNCVRMIKDRTGATPVPDRSCRSARRPASRAIVDLITMEEWTWKGEDLGADLDPPADPRRASGRGRRDARDDGRARRRDGRRRRWRPTSTASEPDVDDAAQADPQGHAGDEVRPGPLRLGVQEQGRAADAERASSTSCRTRSTCRPTWASSRATRPRPATSPRSADDAQPFSGLAFKIMNDPFVGSLTFTRIYSGSLKKGDQLLNSTKGKRERVGRMMMMHAINREEIDEAFAGDIIALAGLKDTTTGDTLCDPTEAGGARDDDLPGAGDRDRRRAQDQERPGEDGHGLQRLAAEDPSFRVETDHRERPDDHEGHGRASPRHPRRPAEARVQGRGQHRRAAGGLPRDDQPQGRDRLHPQEADRRLGPVRADQARHRADRSRARATRSRARSSAARCPRNTSRASRRASSR